MAQATARLKTLLERELGQYETDIDNLTDEATDVIEQALRRGRDDPRDVIRDYVRDASQLANDHYERQRQLWAQETGIDMPDFDHSELVDPDRVLWQQQGGFTNTDFNGLTFQQVKEGRSRAGMTIDDLWPPLTDIDDAQQFIADMIATAVRVTVQRNIRADPTRPRWARVCHGTRPCAFCVTLAARGYEYTSRESADFGGSFHDGHCKCTVEPNWGEDTHLLDQQRKWMDMYDTARRSAGTSDMNAVTVAMNHLYPDEVRGGVYELSAPWPDDVIRPYKRIWRHILDGHGPGTRVRGKTHFPDDWTEEKVKWAVRETICAPDTEPMTAPDGRIQRRRKLIDGQMIEVYLKIRRNTHGMFGVESAYPITEQERRRYGQ
ncbi:hypothetical protein [Bifidobacterium phasiani]|uniref:Phage protein n=1 Tax=Bifidobacterium phasiani TaxID=2834431 RepID=A0ABS6W8A3_9BIFI|nr:hypothetical protein [Bifidobacterium phasiani]MBW3081976.1 hypothetical protein [Bifidobacterium phasiani]